MRRALIGHTGFVGSNLTAAGSFSDRYNSVNIGDMRGERFDEVLCAGVSAVKWLANNEPERDWAGIQKLVDVLRTVKAEHVTLISTIDVYTDPSRPLDERDEPQALDVRPNEVQPYGRHRWRLERTVRELFDRVLIARLPALFGRGLKKNVVFDLLSANQVDRINPASSFQWYPLDRLPADLEIAKREGLATVNLFPEPLSTGAILEALFPEAEVGPPVRPAPRYDLRTRHSALFGGPAGYLMGAERVLSELSAFVESARARPREMLGP